MNKGQTILKRIRNNQETVGVRKVELDLQGEINKIKNEVSGISDDYSNYGDSLDTLKNQLKNYELDARNIQNKAERGMTQLKISMEQLESAGLEDSAVYRVAAGIWEDFEILVNDADNVFQILSKIT